MLDIILLGTGGTQPLPERALAAACITVGGSSLLLDCGEGTQTAARRAGVSIFRMDAILLTHYHGDHIFGLPGIWQTMAAQGRTAPLVMAGPPGLTDVVRTFYAVAGPLPFDCLLYTSDAADDLIGACRRSPSSTGYPAADMRSPCRGRASLIPSGQRRRASPCVTGPPCKAASRWAASCGPRFSARRAAG